MQTCTSQSRQRSIILVAFPCALFVSLTPLDSLALLTSRSEMQVVSGFAILGIPGEWLRNVASSTVLYWTNLAAGGKHRFAWRQD